MVDRDGTPGRTLGTLDVVAIIVGLVVGAGIFKAPSVVAANVGSESALVLAWLLGGAVSLLGALCYAELAAAYPSIGGEYHFLKSAYGRRLGFLFVWSRLVVLQTGSIAVLAYVLGDYSAQLLPLGPHGVTLYAAAAVLLLTLLNILGLTFSKWLQNLLTLVTVGGLLLVIAAGLSAEAVPAAAPTTPTGERSAFGLAMVFVLLTYGGWNEAAYVSAELRDGRRGMAGVLLVGLGIITGLYLLANLSYLRVLGLAGMSGSEVVTADLVRLTLGDGEAALVSLLIVVAVLASINVTILTGARANYALARDFPPFAFLGHWQRRAEAPVNALLVQGAIALLLVLAGSFGRSGFETLVQYVSPVFWLFFLLTALSLLVLRKRDPERRRPFRVPAYPLPPLVFISACGYMLYSSLAYAGWGALLGVGLLAAGLPFLLFDRPAPPSENGH